VGKNGGFIVKDVKLVQHPILVKIENRF